MSIKINHFNEFKELKRRLTSIQTGLNENNIKASNQAILSIIDIINDYIVFEEMSAKCDCKEITRQLI